MTKSTVAVAATRMPVHGEAEPRAKTSFWALTLGSLGVVYGDIGTSPLYALREAVQAAAGPGELPSRAAVLGVLSLILWALIIIVTLVPHARTLGIPPAACPVTDQVGEDDRASRGMTEQPSGHNCVTDLGTKHVRLQRSPVIPPVRCPTEHCHAYGCAQIQ
jgi:K+ potassium transporter